MRLDRQQVDVAAVAMDDVARDRQAEAGAAGRTVARSLQALERGKGALGRATEAAERALQKFDGQDVPMSAIFATATK